MLRRWILIALCLALPLSGLARVDTRPPPCPMHAAMAAAMEMALASGEAPEALSDCCNDLETFVLTGQACKTAPDAGAPVAWLPPQAAATMAPPAHALGAGPPPSLHRPGPAAAIWRPPARA